MRRDAGTDPIVVKSLLTTLNKLSTQHKPIQRMLTTSLLFKELGKDVDLAKINSKTMTRTVKAFISGVNKGIISAGTSVATAIKAMNSGVQTTKRKQIEASKEIAKLAIEKGAWNAGLAMTPANDENPPSTGSAQSGTTGGGTTGSSSSKGGGWLETGL